MHPHQYTYVKLPQGLLSRAAAGGCLTSGSQERRPTVDSSTRLLRSAFASAIDGRLPPLPEDFLAVCILKFAQGHPNFL